LFYVKDVVTDFPSDESDIELSPSTPLASSGQSEKVPTTTRKISHLARRGQRNILHDFEDTAMDFEPDIQPSKHLRFADDIKTSSLLHPKDFSMGDIEMDDHGTAPNTTNHDTGYQTTSLQSTNQDTGYQTTSLQSTNQDTGYQTTSLPLTNQDTGYQTTSLQLTNQYTGLTSSQTKPFSVTSKSEVPPSTNLTSLFSKLPMDSVLHDPNPPSDFPDFIAKDFETNASNSLSSSKLLPNEKPLIEQILDVTNPEQFGHAPYSEEEILERARHVLDMVNRLYPEVKSPSNDPEEEDMTSMILNKTGLSLLHELEPIVSSTPQKDSKGHNSNTVAASKCIGSVGSDKNCCTLGYFCKSQILQNIILCYISFGLSFFFIHFSKPKFNKIWFTIVANFI
jgi:hypothetical protein